MEENENIMLVLWAQGPFLGEFLLCIFLKLKASICKLPD
ncbi:hypothetical protein D081_1000 [Anaerovibrio sp. JC8]|nr:hypothetical protein D081_1000 [Anaerovibrio sp. JC8]